MATAAQRAHTSALVGTWVFVLSDAVGFVALLSTMAALRSDSPAFASANPDMTMGIVATAILTMVSVALVLAARGLGKVWVWLLCSLVGSVGFCGLQYAEYQAMLGPNYALATPAQEAFVVVTAYHLVHVAAGGLALAWALIRQGICERAAPLGPLSVYWHFVDALWLLIFAFFYLL